MSWASRSDWYGDSLRPGMEARLGTTRFRRAGLCSLAMSPDGKFVACGAVDGGVVVWKARTGMALFRSQVGGAVHAVAFRPTGSTLATAGADGIVRLWELMDGRTSREIDGHGGPVYTLAFSPDGKRLLSGGGGRAAGTDRWARVWEIEESDGPVEVDDEDTGVIDPSAPESLQGVMDLAAANSDLRSSAFSPSGARVAVAGSRTVRAFDARSGKRLAHAKFESDIGGVGWTTESTLMVALGSGELVRWDFERSERVSLELGLAPIRALAVSPGSELAVAGDQHGILHVVSVTDLVVQRRIVAHDGACTKVAWSPQARVVVSLAEGQASPRLWAVEAGKRVIKGEGHEGGVRRTSAGGPIVATVGEDARVGLWDLEGRWRGALQARDPEVVPPPAWREVGQIPRLQPDDAVPNPDGTAVWVLVGGKLLRYAVPAEVIRGEGLVEAETVGSFGEGGLLTRAALGPWLGLTVKAPQPEVLVLDGTGGRVVVREALTGPAAAMAFFGTTVLAACNGRQVRRWSLQTGQFMDEVSAGFDPCDFGVGVTALSDEGTLGYYADRVETVWDTATGEVLHRFEEGLEVTSAAFSPDRRWLVTGQGDGTLVVRDLEKGPVKRVAGHEGPVTDLRFISEKALLSASGDGTSARWDLKAMIQG